MRLRIEKEYIIYLFSLRHRVSLLTVILHLTQYMKLQSFWSTLVKQKNQVYAYHTKTRHPNFQTRFYNRSSCDQNLHCR